ncbi:MAG: hypothetical protein AB8B56_02750 [Crocinitomicaceae bacterium]
MSQLNILILFIVVSLSPFYSKAQQAKHNIRAVEEIDDDLIGVRLKKGVKLLGLDTNFRVISEPPGKYRGVRSLEIDGWQVQLIVKKTLVNRRIKSKGVYAGIKNKRIIGVSWMSPDKCDSKGEVIPQHAYNRFGPCD